MKPHRRAIIGALAAAAVAAAVLPASAEAAYYRNLSRLPQDCRTVSDASLLDCYLSREFYIQMQISWYVPGAGVPWWQDWPASLKADLNREFALAMDWYEKARPHLRASRLARPGTAPRILPFGPMPAPLERFEDPLPKPAFQVENYRVLVSRDVAKRVYFSWVANSLAAEITAAHPWSLRDYDPSWLGYILGSVHFFTMVEGLGPFGVGGGLYTSGKLTPSNATYVVDFLRRYAILEDTDLRTIGRLIEWGSRLSHYFKSHDAVHADPTEFWGPSALPIPQSFMIDKTQYTGTNDGWEEPRHWTLGCTGTTPFVIWTLRAANVPVEYVQSPCHPHAAPHFLSQGLAMSHADEMHNRLIRNHPQIPGEELLMPYADYLALFPPPSQDPGCEVSNTNMSRRVAELAIDYLTDGLLQLYCEDEWAGSSHADGKVFGSLVKHYTLAELEQMQLWENLAAKAAWKGLNC